MVPPPVWNGSPKTAFTSANVDASDNPTIPSSLRRGIASAFWMVPRFGFSMQSQWRQCSLVSRNLQWQVGATQHDITSEVKTPSAMSSISVS
jgi:hypothetical protein